MLDSNVIHRYRISVVEDDHHLRNDLLDYLNWKGFDAVGFESVAAFEALHNRRPVDLVLLDIGLPDQSGLTLLSSLRQQASPPGVVLLTSFGSDDMRIQGLSQGADAYLVKGTSLEVIEATCNSVLRRMKGRSTQPQPSAHEGWYLAAGIARLHAPNGVAIELTHMETVFLNCLMDAPCKPVSRESVLIELGKPNTYNNLRNLDNCATRLRRKVQSSSGLELPVRACYGQGYAFGESAKVGVT
jgi:two-component system, OmpR family, response regulator